MLLGSLLRGLRTSIVSKLLLAVSGVVLLAIALQAWLYVLSVAREDTASETRNLLLLERGYEDDVRALELEAGALATAFADRPHLAEQVAAGDRASLLEMLSPVFRTLQRSFGVVHLYVHRPDGYVLLRVHDPDRFGDQVSDYRHSIPDAVRRREAVTGIELDPNRLGVRGVAPVLRDGEVVAVVEVGLDYDEDFLEGLRARKGADYRVWVSLDAAAPSGLWPRGVLPSSPSPRLFHYAATTEALPHPPPADYEAVLDRGQTLIRFVDEGGRNAAVLLAPLRGYGDQILGVLEITASREEALARVWRTQALTVGLAVALAAVALALMVVATRTLVLRSLRHLTALAQRWSSGDRDARAAITGGDELGVLGRTFNLLADRIAELLQDMEREVATSRAAERAAQYELAERQRLEKQLQQAQKMEAVGRLAGGVAHDFNNLLTVIAGNVELAAEALPPDDPAREYLEDLRKAAESAASLTRQLLAFSRRQLVQPQVLSLNELVSRISSMLRRLVGEDIRVRLELAPALGPVRVDPVQFEQVLMNLAANARDAMPGGGALTIRTQEVVLADGEPVVPPLLGPGRYAQLVVCDEGPGMSEAVRGHIFEPFFTTKPKGRGTGLGLAMVFGAVTQAGGAIQVESAPGRGTAFFITLPLSEVRAQPSPSVADSPVAARGAETVLLVEDDVMVRNLAVRLLRRLGYSVHVAFDGPEALAVLGALRDPVDLLFTDVVMPGMNGRELAEKALALLPGLKVLFTSGYAEQVIATRGVVDSGVHVIVKPYSLQELAQAIRAVLDDQGRR